MRRGSGNGKLILFGEHSAVYGHPAVGTPLLCRTILEWHENPPVSASHAQPEILTPNEHGEDRSSFLSLLNRAYSSYGDLVPERGIWKRKGDVPRVGGFGSSAALCVALSRVILGNNSPGYQVDVHRMANFLEGQFHGTPSGIDTGMACDEQPAAWQKSDTGLALRRPLSFPRWPLIYGALPRTGSTAESVARLAQQINTGNTRVIDALEELGHIAETFINWNSATGTIQRQETTQFVRFAANLTNRAQHLLASLSLSTPALNEIIREARNQGAPGAKLSGGGMGGAFFICSENREQRNRLLETLSERFKSKGLELAVPLQALDVSSNGSDSETGD